MQVKKKYIRKKDITAITEWGIIELICRANILQNLKCVSEIGVKPLKAVCENLVNGCILFPEKIKLKKKMYLS